MTATGSQQLAFGRGVGFGMSLTVILILAIALFDTWPRRKK